MPADSDTVRKFDRKPLNSLPALSALQLFLSRRSDSNVGVEAVRTSFRQCLLHRLLPNTENTKESRSSTESAEGSSPIIL